MNLLCRIPLKLTRPEDHPFAHRGQDGSRPRISTVHFDRVARFRTIEPRGEETPFGWWQGPVLVYVRSPSTGQHSGLSDQVVQSTPVFLPFKSTLERKSLLASSLASHVPASNPPPSLPCLGCGRSRREFRRCKDGLGLAWLGFWRVAGCHGRASAIQHVLGKLRRWCVRRRSEGEERAKGGVGMRRRRKK